jgi:peptidoglycan/xylan/chitin deacetylase (PgdA/CDA1 family)
MNDYVLLFSQISHFLAYSIKKPKMRLEKGMLIFSIDVDVGSKELGIINGGTNDRNVSPHISEYELGAIEEAALPLSVEVFNDFGVPVTYAIRGQLTESNDSILKFLLRSSVKHDIGAHGYYHRVFTDLSHNEAENELNMISSGMKKFGIAPRSFVFPKNRVAHLNLLEKHGYECYRSYGDLMKDCMHIEKEGRLYNIHPSLYLGQGMSPRFLEKILNIAVIKKSPLHIWFHLWNFGKEQDCIAKNVNRILVPLLKCAKKKEENGILTFETMSSAAENVNEHSTL